MINKTIISHKQVIAVEREGIVYLDDDGHEQFIDFEKCYQRYLERRLSPEGIESFKRLNHKTDDDVAGYITMVKEWREIADRNTLGQAKFVDGIARPGLPYLEFHTEPRIRIEFETEEELWEICIKLVAEGDWRTFDLT